MKVLVAESLGVCTTHFSVFKVIPTGILVKFKKHVRGDLTPDHDNDEYLYFKNEYGFSEVYDFIRADNLNDATKKAV